MHYWWKHGGSCTARVVGGKKRWLPGREQMVGMVPCPSIHHHPSPHGRPCPMFRTKKAQKLEEDQTSMLKWNLCNHFSHTKPSLDPPDSLTADISPDCENQTRVPVFLILIKQATTLPSGTKLFELQWNFVSNNAICPNWFEDGLRPSV